MIGSCRRLSWFVLGLANLASASAPPRATLAERLVFVSRQIPESGSIYWDEAMDLPGVGPHSRVRPAAPGKLLLLEPDGDVVVLVDGSNPTEASLHLIDVNAPAVSYDGGTIVFAGLPQGSYNLNPATTVGAWRLYVVSAAGTGLRQLTFSDQNDLDYSQFGPNGQGLRPFDDYDPVFLPDGRVCFSSTRWPSVAQYSGVRSSNLNIVNLDGSRLHRITAERNGADRPTVDPTTGKIVFARWWRNHRFPLNSMDTVETSAGGVFGYTGKAYLQHLGLTRDRNNHVGGADSMFRNAWQIAAINPDGTGLQMLSGVFRSEDANHFYGGAFTPAGALYANYFPMANMTEAAGFGGIRLYSRGPNGYAAVNGISRNTLNYVHCPDPGDCSYGINDPPDEGYTAEPEVLADGRVVFSAAPDPMQDYGLWVMNANGSNRELLYDLPGTTELRARSVAARPIPPILPDVWRDDDAPFLQRLPPPEAGPYDSSGTFSFDALNVYFNAPVDWDIVSAIPVGSAGSIRFFIDHQRQSPGSFPRLDWPILLGERSVAPNGFVREPAAPAGVPLFEQIRSPQPSYVVPLTGGPYPEGSAHVAGMNYGAPGARARCVGCHAGHTQIPVPVRDADAQWTNLAPGAAITVSSSRDSNHDGGLIDRRVLKGEIWRYWNSASGQQTGQWVKLTFPVLIRVRSVRLYNPRFGDEASSTIQVDAATVRLFSDQAGTLQVASASAQNVAVSGTDVEFDPVTTARVVRVDLDSVSGTFYGSHLAALAEVEVIGSGDPEAVPLPPLPVPAGSELLTAGMILAVALCARRGDRMRRSRQV